MGQLSFKISQIPPPYVSHSHLNMGTTFSKQYPINPSPTSGCRTVSSTCSDSNRCTNGMSSEPSTLCFAVVGSLSSLAAGSSPASGAVVGFLLTQSESLCTKIGDVSVLRMVHDLTYDEHSGVADHSDARGVVFTKSAVATCLNAGAPSIRTVRRMVLKL